MAEHSQNIELLPPSFSAWAPAKPRNRQIVMLMSGGIDSSVCAHLLKKAGWDVLGITMKTPVNHGTGDRDSSAADTALLCQKMGITHYVVDVTKAFEQLIVQPFQQSYAAGQTPNPCADCNARLKFSLVWDLAQETFGIDYLATGHYARISFSNYQAHLGRAADKSKDQSYFLYGLAREKLTRLVLPLGELTKDDARAIARQLNINVADKPESMELCFAGAGDYRQALPEDQINRCGTITDMQGNEIGTHQGIANYTIGQRRGIGFAGGKPLYVGRINVADNTIALGAREEVCTNTISANRINRLIPQELTPRARLNGKIRSYGDPAPCKLTGLDQDEITVEFDEPRFAPCPGQKLVLYNQDENIVAGGTIIPS